MIVPVLLASVFDLAWIVLFLKAVKRIDRVESATCYSDLHFLFLLARDGWGKGLIAEIGAFKGKSTCVLALASKSANREQVVSIDPHIEGTEGIYRGHLKRMKLTERVRPVISDSESAAGSFDAFCAAEGWGDHRIRLLFIDGCHEYDFVKKDILLWKDRLIDGGVMAFHDYNWEGVRRALDELVKDNPEFCVEGTVGRTLFVSKGSRRNSFIFERMRFFDGAKRLLLRRGALKYGKT